MNGIEGAGASQTALYQEVEACARDVSAAGRKLAALPGEQRSAALNAMADELAAARTEVAAANAADLAEAGSLSPPLRQRLQVDDKVFSYILRRLRAVAQLPDPLGEVIEGTTRPNGLEVRRVRVSLGAIGIIYESRPNVTTDAAAVCVRSGNAVLLRGGSEALRTNLVLAEAMRRGATRCGLPEAAIRILGSADREAVHALLRQDRYLDVLIPRGGRSLVETVSRESRIPVIKHYDGVCHLYLAADAPEATAVALTINSKCQRVEVCNALETLLVDEAAASRLLPALATALAAAGVTLRGCPRTRQIIACETADETDWAAEYLAPMLAVRVVPGIDAAIEHINTCGSGHTDAIVTQNLERSRYFCRLVDSASVLVNASTRLSGGGDYGLGAVLGISTDKLHARGPVGPRELTSYKWIAIGQGHLRE